MLMLFHLPANLRSVRRAMVQTVPTFQWKSAHGEGRLDVCWACESAHVCLPIEPCQHLALHDTARLAACYLGLTA